MEYMVFYGNIRFLNYACFSFQYFDIAYISFYQNIRAFEQHCVQTSMNTNEITLFACDRLLDMSPHTLIIPLTAFQHILQKAPHKLIEAHVHAMNPTFFMTCLFSIAVKISSQDGIQMKSIQHRLENLPPPKFSRNFSIKEPQTQLL